MSQLMRTLGNVLSEDLHSLNLDAQADAERQWVEDKRKEFNALPESEKGSWEDWLSDERFEKEYWG